VVLAQKLRAAWEASESKLPLERLEAKLKEGLHGQNVKGLGRSSIGRYMDPEHTTLPDKAVLAALAKIFEVSDEELAEWHRLHTEAKAGQRRRQLQRPVSDRPAAAPVHDAATEGRSQQEAADTPETLAHRPRVMWRRPTLVAVAAVGLVVLAGIEVTTLLGDKDKTPSAATTPEPLAQECRTNWEPVRQASLYVMPCIGHDNDRVTISVKYKAIPQDGIPGEATVWLWLMNTDLIKNHTFQMTRNESTLRRCRIHLDDGDQVKTCGPFPLAPPTKEGVYTTSSSARINDSVYPPGWDDPGFAGTQGGSLPWKGKS
jgi:hypothetical protein